jgi:peptidoglycan/xylan/chitin deacetylase (PgdA/CDA1 family)
MNSKQFAHNYRDLYTPTLRAIGRDLLLKMFLVCRATPSPSKRGVHFLYLHHLFTDEERNFEEILVWLEKSGYHFISYSEAVQRIITGDIDKQHVCLSFDDGVDNCLKAGQILARYDISACFFLNTAMIDEEHQIHPMLITAKQYGRLPVRYLSWADSEQLKSLGHEIGGHTHSHINMAMASSDQLAFEIGHNKELLEQRLGPIAHFAWPFGRFQHFSAEARRAVYKAGYHSCASAERGIHVTQAENSQFCIHRDGVVAAWPLAQTRYLLARSAANYAVPANSWGAIATKSEK